MTFRTAAVAACAAGLLAAGCGGTAHARPSNDVLACQHFKAQGKKFARVAAPTLLDDAQAVAWVKEDAALARNPQLKHDLRTWVNMTSAWITHPGSPPPGNLKAPIVADCQRLGAS